MPCLADFLWQLFVLFYTMICTIVDVPIPARMCPAQLDLLFYYDTQVDSLILFTIKLYDLMWKNDLFANLRKVFFRLNSSALKTAMHVVGASDNSHRSIYNKNGQWNLTTALFVSILLGEKSNTLAG